MSTKQKNAPDKSAASKLEYELIPVTPETKTVIGQKYVLKFMKNGGLKTFALKDKPTESYIRELMG